MRGECERGGGRSRTSDTPHRRSLRGSFSSQSPENTCRPAGHLQQHRGLLCDGLNGVWKDQQACCWRRERFIGGKNELFEELNLNLSEAERVKTNTNKVFDRNHPNRGSHAQPGLGQLLNCYPVLPLNTL